MAKVPIEAKTAKLKKELTLPLVTLYGIGVTVGAGIYVLVGAASAKAGVYAQSTPPCPQAKALQTAEFPL